MGDAPSTLLILGLRFGLLALLYVFLAAVVWAVWRDLRATANRATQTERPMARLVVEDDGGSELKRGESFNLIPVTAIGRDLSNTIVLSDPTISSQHTLLSYRDGHWWVEDLGSRNGTYVNNTRVLRPLIISPGDVVGVGRIQLRLVL
jgi:hypothetical protein